MRALCPASWRMWMVTKSDCRSSSSFDTGSQPRFSISSGERKMSQPRMRQPKPLSRAATIVPILPTPMMPTVQRHISRFIMIFGNILTHLPCTSAPWARAMLRISQSMSATTRSATAVELRPSALYTAMPRSRQRSRIDIFRAGAQHADDLHVRRGVEHRTVHGRNRALQESPPRARFPAFPRSQGTPPRREARRYARTS